MKITTIHMRRHSHMALYKQLYESLRSDIFEGFMHQGDQLPSLRMVARQLQISRTSVERAYTQLEIEGYIRADAKRGYFVSATSGDIQVRKQIVAPLIQQTPAYEFDLGSRGVDSEGFDFAVWKRYVRDILDQKAVISTYGAVAGEWELRLALQQYAFSGRGVIGDIQQFVVGASFQTLLALVCGLLEGHPVIGMEAGSFPQAQQIFRDFRFPIHFIHCDDEDVMIKELNEHQISIFYCHTPAFGHDLQPIRANIRDALLLWAEAANHYIIEDDHNGEFSSGDHVRCAMQGYDHHQHTFYFGSFSKLLLPSLRIAYVVLPPTFAKRFAKRVNFYNATASKVEQKALARYISDGHLAKHVRRLRRHYKMKQDAMDHWMQSYFHDMEYTLSQAALCYHLRIPMSLIKDVVMRCEQDRIRIQSDESGIVLSYAGIGVDEMELALGQLHKHIVGVMHLLG